MYRGESSYQMSDNEKKALNAKMANYYGDQRMDYSSAKDFKTSYHVELRVQKALESGQTLCVLGSIPELGEWKELKCRMKCTSNNYWVLEKPLITNKYFFCYKYVITHSNATQIEMWERGVDRIADCEILAEVPSTNPPSFYDHTSGANLQS